MNDESLKFSSKTWARTADFIHKTTYSDGVVDGLNSTFQASFDTGYEEGMKFGFSIGLSDALSQNGQSREITIVDPEKINCLLCVENNKIDDNVINLINLQKERNYRLLSKT